MKYNYSIQLKFTRKNYKGVEQLVGIVWLSCDKDGNYDINSELDESNDSDFKDIIKAMAVYGNVEVETGSVIRDED